MKRYVRAVLGGLLAILAAFDWTVSPQLCKQLADQVWSLEEIGGIIRHGGHESSVTNCNIREELEQKIADTYKAVDEAQI